MFITYARKIEQSDWSIVVEYVSIFHPNIPPLMLDIRLLYVATMDTVVSLTRTMVPIKG